MDADVGINRVFATAALAGAAGGAVLGLVLGLRLVFDGGHEEVVLVPIFFAVVYALAGIASALPSLVTGARAGDFAARRRPGSRRPVRAAVTLLLAFGGNLAVNWIYHELALAASLNLTTIAICLAGAIYGAAVTWVKLP